MLNPYGFHNNWPNHGFIAQVPMLSGYIALYLLRSSDLYSLDCLYQKKYRTPCVAYEIGDKNVATALFLIRIAAALFFFQWGVEKFVAAEMSEGMLERWYGVKSYQDKVVILLGCFQILLALALLAGLFRRLTYGLAALVKLKTCWAIAPLLLFPFVSENGGRLSSVGASIPVLAALLFLYLVREWDIYSVDLKYFRKSQQ